MLLNLRLPSPSHVSSTYGFTIKHTHTFLRPQTLLISTTHSPAPRQTPFPDLTASLFFSTESRKPARRRRRHNPRQPNLHRPTNHRSTRLPRRRPRKPYTDDDVPAACPARGISRAERGGVCRRDAGAREGVYCKRGGEGVRELHARQGCVAARGEAMRCGSGMGELSLLGSGAWVAALFHGVVVGESSRHQGSGGWRRLAS